ncbi:MAG: hemolysin [Bacteroidetes bacterium]|nr:MAG: hemolysin [Bacteroidota bacterium]
MKDIIPEIDRKLLMQELNDDTFIRRTNNGNKEIFVVDYHNAPNVLQEIGRLREITFRAAGGGTGKEVDIDEYDTEENPFKQLVVWDPVQKDIVGGYRFKEGREILKTANGEPNTPTSHLFCLCERFVKEYLPNTIELGRSFVQPNYQPNYDLRKGLYSLDNLWDGLGCLTVDYSYVDYFFGKITMYPSFNVEARDFILYFLNIYFKDTKGLIEAKFPISYKFEESYLKEIFVGDDYIKDYKTLNHKVRSLGENIPPLVNSYMNLSPNMKVFGTSVNERFGDVEETGILIKIEDIYPAKKDRHIHNINRERIQLDK